MARSQTRASGISRSLVHYNFQELGKVSCRQIAASLRHTLVGKLAVNTAFDSGLIQQPQWQHINCFPVTPLITERLVDEWPVSHDAFCDEWWVFGSDIPPDFKVHNFCNYVGM